MRIEIIAFFLAPPGVFLRVTTDIIEFRGGKVTMVHIFLTCHSSYESDIYFTGLLPLWIILRVISERCHIASPIV